MTIETKKLVISEELKRKIEMICKFAYVEYSFTNGYIINLKNTNIAYVKPHILKVKGNDYLIFENSEIDFNKKIKELDKQMDRIKNAYIKGILKIDDFDKEIKHIDFKKNELLNKQKEQKQYESLSFTLDDLLILEDKQEIEMFTNPSNYLSSFYK